MISAPHPIRLRNTLFVALAVRGDLEAIAAAPSTQDRPKSLKLQEAQRAWLSDAGNPFDWGDAGQFVIVRKIVTLDRHHKR